MNRLITLLLCGIGAFTFVGCPPRVVERPAVEVIVDGGEGIPDDLVGVWRADSGGWEFVIEADGTISSAVVSLGRVRLEPGRRTVVPMKMGGKGVFDAGQWTLHYSYERRELTVEITVENFRAELGENVIKGSSMDLFTGTVSPDGRSWWANRFSFPQYVADTKKHRDYEFIVDPNETPPEELLFQKITEEGWSVPADPN
jgi:hypothetical protein